VDAISEGDIYAIDPEKCIDCGACADVCPVEAIHPE
jgi:NAD-dependent dihydropyrimidine dehydrogenase PreA subunit